MAEAAASDSDESYNNDEVKPPVDEFFDAIWFNNTKKVSEMLDNGFSVTSVSSFDDMALHYAVLNNKIKSLRLFKERMLDGQINTIHVNSSDDTICGTPLHTASEEQVPVEMFRQLLEWGADPNALSAKGEPVLHHLIAMGWQDFEAGFENEYIGEEDAESTKDKGHSYLEKMRLLQKNMTKLFLSYCNNVKSGDTHGRILLHIASEFSNYVFLEEILNFKLDVNKQDRFGHTPLHLITHNKNHEELDLVLTIVTTLIQNGSDVNIRDNHGSTPSHHAVHMANAETLKRLIDHGALLSVTDNKNRSVYDLGRLEGTGEIKEVLGILYDRSVAPIVKGVTDLRFGWFYPQCCHKDYHDDKLHGVVDSPTVNHKDIKNGVEKACKEDTDEIRQSLLSVFNDVAVYMGSFNKLYECSVVLGGSVSEGTKVGSPDEYDIVFNLERIVEMVSIEENADTKDYVFLKVRNRETLEEYGLKDTEDGYLKRTEISKMFHKLFEQCLRKKDVWSNSKFLCDWGTADAFGEAINIGQLKLVWYGPTLKRQDVSVDIVPVIKIPWMAAEITP
ncbi:hypothetical protein KUTeg_024709 [Tegillarca granosa]|uniref:Mab-21-like nucleotidyltransferase domain-containing protein n=1 Tax=Tegillarca granosa TaxID=220873 RepID=A0ABQ9DY53_TEGGR|nr:hypothetical protein KUTeg_024709 [Tegillarca granosa]